ncbi:isoamylase early set domain-containing protein [Desulforhopalus sp. 52FAK]
MLTKNYSKTGKICRVTFRYNNPENAAVATLVGDFNSWSFQNNPMKKRKDGSFSTTLSLLAGNSYAFRYVLNGNTWVNDEKADNYQPNDFGEDNSVVVV